MASSPSGSQNSASGSEGDYYLQQQHVTEQRKRKRMVSNRESARRSRMRKQQHVDDLTGEVGQLKKENNQISTSIGVTTDLYLKIEAENAILRAQMAELSNRLQSLNEIMQYINSINSNSNSNCCNIFDGEITHFNDFGFMNPWNGTLSVNQPIMASSDMLMY